jgi:ATP-binding cassette, subfamily B, bacterial MsbA
MAILADAQRSADSQVSSFALYKRLLTYVRPYLGTLVIATLALIAAGAIEGSFAKLLEWLIKTMFEKRESALANASLWFGPVVLVLVFMVSAIVGFAGNYGVQWVGNRVILDLREQLFRKLLAAPVQYYDSTSTGAIISRVFNDVQLVQQAATNALSSIFRDTTQAIVALVYMFSTSWKLSLIILLAGPGIAVVIRTFSKRLRSISRQQQLANTRLIEVLDEAVGNHRVVKVFGGTAVEANRFHQAANHMRKLTMKFCAAAAASSPFTQLLITIAMAAMLYYAASSGEIKETSTLLGFVAAIALLQKPLKNLSAVNEQLQRGLAGCESVFSVLDSQSEPEGGETITDCKGQIHFDNVSLRYPGAERAALDGVSLDIRAGETIALVGGSGSGKTTLVHLLPRFYVPNDGQIALDGKPLESLSLQSLREQIALVSQDIKLFNDTVANNIAYGQPNATPEAIRRAAHAAFATDFIEAMPGGFDAPVGENGSRLSGGQRQRVAIARAFLKNAPILLLDEATSALDTESERQVQAALETLMKGRTTIVVAHRLSTIERADRIIVMREGRIVEQGAHADLLKTKGAYAALHAAQFGTQFGS